MNKKIYKIADMVLLIIWCILMTTRVYYPKVYPPMDPYCLVVLFLLVIDIIVLKIKDIYENWRDNIPLQILRSILIITPIIVAISLS